MRARSGPGSIMTRYSGWAESLRGSRSRFGEQVQQRGVHWVKPKFIAQIGFTEWTTDNKLRHPRFLGLRENKSPKDVRREN